MPKYFAQLSSNSSRCDSMKNYDSRGYDVYQFNKDQFYEGEFFRDSFHGEGTYKWNDSGVTYEGGFYSNCKEGYASLSFPDNSYFEGLFIRNQPFGPGIFTYANGRQDAGFWMGKKLVRLSRPVDFIVPRLAPTAAGKIKLLQFRRLIPLEEDDYSAVDILLKYGHPLENFPNPYSELVYDRRSIFFDREIFEKAYFAPSTVRPLEFPCSSPCVILSADLEEKADDKLNEKSVPPHCLCTDDVFMMRYERKEIVDFCDVESRGSSGEEEMGILTYFTKHGADGRLGKDRGESVSEVLLGESVEKNGEESRKDTSKILKIVSWNRSDLCTEMLKQIFRFRDFEGKLNFNLSKLMVGARTAFRKTGENEKQCLHFLKMCSLGPAQEVKSILCSGNISEELMDARGNNSLMFAAATDQHDVIDVLLNYGVDVNTFNDEGLTPLNLCLLRRLAQANGISNWETAFLPKEFDEFQEVDSQTQEYPLRESVSSLDRIFGDGMSIAESNILRLESGALSPILLPPLGKASLEKKQSSEGGKDNSRSCLGVNAASKSIGSFSVLNWEWDFRNKKTSLLAVSNPTPTLNIKIIPKSVRRDEFQRSIQKTSRDNYFFEFDFDNLNAKKKEESYNLVKKRNSKKVDMDDNWAEGEGDQEDEDEEEEEEEEKEKEYDPNNLNRDLDLTERISKIDKTISMLLSRGADPNISEVPKPSTHLGIYTKDFKTVQNLLSCGADPDSPLHSNEGLLTPLHVITLRESAPEYVDLCQLLLNFKANPDKETLPEFALSEEEKQYLDPECGRTPLQLLCMRPDLEYADENGNLITVGLMLARVCQRKLLYNGHSYLTLAMLFGNVKLLEAFLSSRFFDPKAILGKNRGTCLHVLVSSELQKKIPYDTSIKMCKLLIRAGADPLKRFKHPRALRGTCIDFGKREIEAERKSRKSTAESADTKQSEKPRQEKHEERDYLKDHQRLIEYLTKMAAHLAKKKCGTKQTQQGKLNHRNLNELPFSAKSKRQRISNFVTAKERNEENGSTVTSEEGGEGNVSVGQAEEGGDEYEGTAIAEERKLALEKKQEEKRKRLSVSESTDADNFEFASMRKSFKTVLSEQNNGWTDISNKQGNNQDVSVNTAEHKKSSSVKTKEDRLSIFRGTKGVRESVLRKKKEDRESIFRGTKGVRESVLRQKKKDHEGSFRRREKLRESVFPKKKEDRESVFRQTKGKLGHASKKNTGPESKEVKEYSRSSKNMKSTDNVKKERIKKGERTIEKTEKENSGDANARKEKNKKAKEREKELELGKLSRSVLKINTNESNVLTAAKLKFARSLSDKKLSCYEVFPEKLRQVLLRLYGTCSNVDVNEFLMPYVVLRDGELYYKFKRGATKQKEQYSLI